MWVYLWDKITLKTAFVYERTKGDTYRFVNKREERGLSVSDFAHALHYERTNIYKIFKRSSIDVDLLLRISEVLAYDFLREVYLADEPRRYSITIEADKEDIEEIRKWLLEKRRE